MSCNNNQDHKLNEKKTINRGRHQNDTDVKIIQQGFKVAIIKNNLMTKYKKT